MISIITLSRFLFFFFSLPFDSLPLVRPPFRRHGDRENLHSFFLILLSLSDAKAFCASGTPDGARHITRGRVLPLPPPWPLRGCLYSERYRLHVSPNRTPAMRSSRFNSNPLVRWCLSLCLVLLLVQTACASIGDRLPDFKECLEVQYFHFSTMSASGHLTDVLYNRLARLRIAKRTRLPSVSNLTFTSPRL